MLPTIPHSLSRWKKILGQAMFSKCSVVVDEEVDVQNVGEVAWKALNNIDPQRDAPLAGCDPDVAGGEEPG